MPRPLTRAQALQNQAFLAELRRTGNVREAARTLGIHRATLTKRRAKHLAFAAEWDAALALAHARLNGGEQGRATATEPRITRTASGRLQLRRPQRGRLTRAAEQAFLAALSATANVRLAAAAAGFSHSAFYHRRKIHPGFAREMRLALQLGYDRLELALLSSTLPEAHVDDAWRHNDPPPIPPMSVAQALQLMYLHQKEARLLSEPPHIRRRRGETWHAQSIRLEALYEAGLERDREAYRIAEAERRAAATGRSPHESSPPTLPDLAQVHGWSTASGAPTWDDVALFGGWRLDEPPNNG